TEQVNESLARAQKQLYEQSGIKEDNFEPQELSIVSQKFPGEELKILEPEQKEEIGEATEALSRAAETQSTQAETIVAQAEQLEQILEQIRTSVEETKRVAEEMKAGAAR
ncbi:MAG: hypothetical protein AABY22_36290, partial [Nanoarchaeota archaeon]